ncbi:MAG: hypothetical protein VB055_06500 [Oscillospiraceae bacterium]|nr:hypothetical protein [Oscillospiraceae bacterium]
MISTDFNPWKRIDTFDPEELREQSSDLVQWPIKLWKIPSVSPYFHHAHLLVAGDCTAFSHPGFHDVLSRGRIPLICCPENDFDIQMKLSEIFEMNDISSVTVVSMDTPCCGDLRKFVLQAAKHSKLPIPIQVTTLFVDAEVVE